MHLPWCANKLHNGLSKNLTGLKKIIIKMVLNYIKKSCHDIQFLLNWKHSPQFSGTENDSNLSYTLELIWYHSELFRGPLVHKQETFLYSCNKITTT